MNISVPPPVQSADAPASWHDGEAVVIDLALDWVTVRAAGGDGAVERTALDAARAALRDAGAPAAIDRLSDRFGLSAFEEDVLLLALAPELDGGIARQYAAIVGVAGVTGLTPMLVAQLLFSSNRLPLPALARLGPDAVLRRQALVNFEAAQGPMTGSSIALPARVRAWLCSEDFAAPVAWGAQVLPLVSLPPRLMELASALASRAGPLALVGPPHSGRTGIAAAIATQRGRFAWRLELRDGHLPDAAMLKRDLVLGDALAVLIGTPTAALANWCAELGDAVLVVTETPLSGVEAVRLPMLHPDERSMLWAAAWPALDKREARALGEQFALGPSAIARRASSGNAAAAWVAARQQDAPKLEGLATRIVPARCLDDMVLANETRTELEVLVAQARHRAKVLGEWGYRRLLGAATGCAVLFAGPSGVGKTMAAEAVAAALELDLWVVDLAQVTSKYIGETEKNLRSLFDAAEASGALLFFDEADALFGKRSEVKDAHDRYANQEVSYLLQRMERHPGIAILATNLKGNLDMAFLRRLRMVIDFAAPDAAARAALWRRALPPAMPQQDIDIARLARLDLTGGAIMTIASNAAFRAAARDGALTMADLMAAANGEYRKLERDLAELGRP